MKYKRRQDGFSGSKIIVLPRNQIRSACEHGFVTPLVLTDIGYYPSAGGHYVDRKTGVAENIIIFCVGGKGWYSFGGYEGEVNKGEVLIVPKGIAHGYGSNEEDPWTIHWLHYMGEQASLSLEYLNVSIEEPILFVGNQFKISSVFEDMYQSVDRPFSKQHWIYASLTLGHLIGLLRMNRIHADGIRRLAQERVEESIRWMNEHIDCSPKLEDLARKVHCSIPHYSAQFKEETGMAPIDYFIRLKIQKACQLLDTTSLTQKEIAHEIGYDDPYYFSRVFKKVMEVAPSQYRAVQKG